jgi:hypothetical protein
MARIGNYCAEQVVNTRAWKHSAGGIAKHRSQLAHSPDSHSARALVAGDRIMEGDLVRRYEFKGESIARQDVVTINDTDCVSLGLRGIPDDVSLSHVLLDLVIVGAPLSLRAES